MKLGLIIFLALLSGCASQPRVGAIIHPVVGAFGSEGICVGDGHTNEPCAFSMTIYSSNSAPKAVYAMAFVARNAAGMPTEKIIDEVDLPSDMSNKSVRYDACRNNESLTDAVVAVVNNYDRNAPEFVKAAGWAYKLDVQSGKFVKINADAVECAAQVGED